MQDTLGYTHRSQPIQHTHTRTLHTQNQKQSKHHIKRMVSLFCKGITFHGFCGFHTIFGTTEKLHILRSLQNLMLANFVEKLNLESVPGFRFLLAVQIKFFQLIQFTNEISLVVVLYIFIIKPYLELALSIILKDRELYESKHVRMEYRCLII